jgi:hypothetical protein
MCDGADRCVTCVTCVIVGLRACDHTFFLIISQTASHLGVDKRYAGTHDV